MGIPGCDKQAIKRFQPPQIQLLLLLQPGRPTVAPSLPARFPAPSTGFLGAHFFQLTHPWVGKICTFRYAPFCSFLSLSERARFSSCWYFSCPRRLLVSSFREGPWQPGLEWPEQA